MLRHLEAQMTLNVVQCTRSTAKNYLAPNTDSAKAEKPCTILQSPSNTALCYPSLLTMPHSHSSPLRSSNPWYPGPPQGLCISWLLILWSSAQMSLPQKCLPSLSHVRVLFHFQHCSKGEIIYLKSSYLFICIDYMGT